MIIKASNLRKVNFLLGIGFSWQSLEHIDGRKEGRSDVVIHTLKFDRGFLLRQFTRRAHALLCKLFRISPCLIALLLLVLSRTARSNQGSPSLSVDSLHHQPSQFSRSLDHRVFSLCSCRTKSLPHECAVGQPLTQNQSA